MSMLFFCIEWLSVSLFCILLGSLEIISPRRTFDLFMINYIGLIIISMIVGVHK